MFIAQLGVWFVISCIIMSFIEHQVHSRLMHKSTKTFNKAFLAHALNHHKHYSKIFTDEPVPPGEDQEIRLTVHKAPVKAIPFAIVIALFSWQCALMFVAVVVMHHWIWNQIHLEMHKPENRIFSKWPAYIFLARYHCLHHVHPDKNFNVVFPFADYVMGTAVHPSESDKLYLSKQGF